MARYLQQVVPVFLSTMETDVAILYWVSSPRQDGLTPRLRQRVMPRKAHVVRVSFVNHLFQMRPGKEPGRLKLGVYGERALSVNEEEKGLGAMNSIKDPREPDRFVGMAGHSGMSWEIAANMRVAT